jgi:enoyl-CoA hydratase/carnithine racemase
MGHVTTRDHDGIVVLTLDRPPANALDVETLEEVVAAAGPLLDDPPAALVLAGRPGFFSAGLDLKAIPGYGPDEYRRLVDGVNEMALGVYALPCPVVCAITGHAIAGGFVLAMCGDVRIAASEGRYGLTEAKVGVPFPQAAIGVVAAELSASAVRALALTGRLVDAEACRRLGAFDEVVAPDAVLDRSLEVARELSALNRETFALIKRQLRGETVERLRGADEPLLQR